eukprot:Gb_03819 [translate_table: standard]
MLHLGSLFGGKRAPPTPMENTIASTSLANFALDNSKEEKLEGWLVITWMKEIPTVVFQSAITPLRKNGGNTDARNTLGLTALHIVVWMNHVPMVRRLLVVSTNPNVRDGESGWSSLHRVLHFRHIAMVGVLIEDVVSLTLEDSRARTLVDLLFGPVWQVITDENNGVVRPISIKEKHHRNSDFLS